ncbi:MAG: MSHA biogenesis protein MshP [Pseudomonadota bacterium]
MAMPVHDLHSPRPPRAWRRAMGCGRTSARGFGAVAAMIVLVLLATLAAAIVRLNWTQQMGSAQDIGASRAAQAAQAGVQWGLYQALKSGWKTSCGAAETLDLRADTGFRVTVSCASTDYSEGESVSGTPQTIRLYTLTAVACNGTANTCPDADSVAGPGYVERRQEVQAVDAR